MESSTPRSYGSFGSSLRDLPRLRRGRRGRASSWDRTGGNRDWITVEPGRTATLVAIEGAGSISHLWMTFGNAPSPGEEGGEPGFLRKVVLRMSWDGEPEPSVEVPVGDFFGATPQRPVPYASLPLQIGPSEGRSFNAYWHMPFASGARIELMSELESDPLDVYYYVDFERFDALDDDLGRFHAQWRRENPTPGIPDDGMANLDFLMEGQNVTGAENYVILDAVGTGVYVGCILMVDNLRETHAWNWFGEGDDMIFIDGDRWPPTLHGTGLEDYFNLAYCPEEATSTAYHGIIDPGGPGWSGLSAFYRFHVEDPIPFEERIRVTIEHGHANRRSDDYTSVAFWYQSEPHQPFGIRPAAERMLRPR